MAKSNLKFSPEIRGGRGSKLRGCLKICSKTVLFLEFSGLILVSKRELGVRMVK